MQKIYKNKKMKKESVKQYFFPEHGQTIEASSLEEAVEKVKKISKAPSKDE